MTRPLITFTSDFGHDDWYVGVVHGAIHAVCPEARVIDLTHAIPPGQVARAAFVLEASCGDFPAGTVHLAVVDPGVGTGRRPLAVQARGQMFVGPDNGLLEWALADPRAEIFTVSETRFFRHPVSHTFHARDVFGPVAAHLAAGETPQAMGARVTAPVRLERAAPHRRDDHLAGRVAFVDHYGNAITDLTEAALSDAFPRVPETRLEVHVAGRTLTGLSRTYGDAPVGHLLALIGSSGRIEIAQTGGDAAKRLGLSPGDEVTVHVSGS